MPNRVLKSHRRKSGQETFKCVYIPKDHHDPSGLGLLEYHIADIGSQFSYVANPGIQERSQATKTATFLDPTLLPHDHQKPNVSSPQDKNGTGYSNLAYGEGFLSYAKQEQKSEPWCHLYATDIPADKNKKISENSKL
ncbi:hypothetical protein CISG_02692 [Coccidioides immitis RMSCC 3703]|uniref:Uncharacterized protein n=2 Tax=Coccidioides TaxID=5500 RepID=A0A0J8R9E9_COCIT|nr:hypothetical protein CPAG_02513 [Coccidioides posadasii RMSCC 3488]KMU81674.1 hypothetical protein CISG_02692 [Coccidioides immitis RMSCC 3703]